MLSYNFKKVTQPQTFAEFKEKNLQNVKNKVAELSEKFLDKNGIMKKMFRTFIVGVVLLCLGILLAIIVASIYFDTPVNRNGSDIFLIFFVIVFFIIAIGFLCIFLFFRIKKNFKNNISSEIKKAGLFYNTLSGLNYKIVDLNNATDEQLNKFDQKVIDYRGDELLEWAPYTYGIGGIPSDANISRAQNIMLIADQFQNTWALQQITWHWIRTYKVKDGVRVENYYRDLFALEGKYHNLRPDDRDLSFSLGYRCAFNRGDKYNTKLENSDFNKRFKVYANKFSSTKIRMIYTPLTMETYLKHCNQETNNRVRNFGLTYRDQRVRAWFLPKGDVLDVDLPFLPISKNKIIDGITNDLLYDVYSIYWVFSFMTIPPYFI